MGPIDDKIATFLNRLIKGDCSSVWPDATYVKVRQQGRIVSTRMIIAAGVNADGRRDMLGMSFGASETNAFWLDFLRPLARRGLHRTRLVISNDNADPKALATRVFNATWRRCHPPQMNVADCNVSHPQ